MASAWWKANAKQKALLCTWKSNEQRFRTFLWIVFGGFVLILITNIIIIIKRFAKLQLRLLFIFIYVFLFNLDLNQFKSKFNWIECKFYFEFYSDSIEILFAKLENQFKWKREHWEGIKKKFPKISIILSGPEVSMYKCIKYNNNNIIINKSKSYIWICGLKFVKLFFGQTKNVLKEDRIWNKQIFFLEILMLMNVYFSMYIYKIKYKIDCN